MIKRISISAMLLSLLAIIFWLVTDGPTKTQLKTVSQTDEDISVTQPMVSTDDINLAEGMFNFSEKSNDLTAEKTLNKSPKVSSMATSDIANSDEIMAAYVKSGNPEEVMRLYAEKRKARAELLQRQMDAENLDPIWADELATKFADLHQVLPGIRGVSLADADCRTSICALHLDFAQADDYRRLAPMIANAGSVLGVDAFVHHDAKPQGAVMYLSREDQILPDLEMLDQG